VRLEHNSQIDKIDELHNKSFKSRITSSKCPIHSYIQITYSLSIMITQSLYMPIHTLHMWPLYYIDHYYIYIYPITYTFNSIYVLLGVISYTFNPIYAPLGVNISTKWRKFSLIICGLIPMGSRDSIVNWILYCMLSDKGRMDNIMTRT